MVSNNREQEHWDDAASSARQMADCISGAKGVITDRASEHFCLVSFFCRKCRFSILFNDAPLSMGCASSTFSKFGKAEDGAGRQSDFIPALVSSLGGLSFRLTSPYIYKITTH